MLNGPGALGALDDALKDIRREEDEITRKIARTTDRIGRLRETELGQLRELARVRLDLSESDAISGKLKAAEDRARDMLFAHGEAMDALEAELAARETALGEMTRARTEAARELVQEQEKLDAFEQTVWPALEADPAYKAALETEREAIRHAENAARKAEQAEADRQEKGEPYRSDPIFLYLWERRFGTPDYAASGLFAMLDAMVARHARFETARVNYALLEAIPGRIATHAEQLGKEADAAAAERNGLETAALDGAGGKSVREAVEALEARMVELDARIVAAEDAREALTEQHKELAEGGDPTFEEALDVLARAMGDVDVAQLLADARRTHTAEDDAVVGRIEDTRRRIGEEETELSDQRARLKTLETRRRELEDLAYEFKKARYDHPNSTFGEDRLAGDMLNDFLKGAITAGAYWEQWRRSQTFSGRTRRQSRPSGFSVPKGGFSPRPPSGTNWTGTSKGGFSRPRSATTGRRGGFKTGGGFGKGGFKTGGGF
ncbi:hypothetical protein [Pelagibacterium montanilacus]|uniref:hypothetical protein n=1 Tax=Pelagibacterium montanilacus TaxID=2185280 RepID=UPI000F8EB44A|nr:hypothetical protein [Pelagibacterium montanilacus]